MPMMSVTDEGNWVKVCYRANLRYCRVRYGGMPLDIGSIAIR